MEIKPSLQKPFSARAGSSFRAARRVRAVPQHYTFLRNPGVPTKSFPSLDVLNVLVQLDKRCRKEVQVQS